MRLTADEARVIRESIMRRFSSVSRILLFGSRVDDSKRGGDIDLFVETNEEPSDAVTHMLEAISDIQFKIGERKIDMVLGKPDPDGDDRAIARVARGTGVTL